MRERCKWHQPEALKVIGRGTTRRQHLWASEATYERQTHVHQECHWKLMHTHFLLLICHSSLTIHCLRKSSRSLVAMISSRRNVDKSTKGHDRLGWSTHCKARAVAPSRFVNILNNNFCVKKRAFSNGVAAAGEKISNGCHVYQNKSEMVPTVPTSGTAHVGALHT